MEHKRQIIKKARLFVFGIVLFCNGCVISFPKKDILVGSWESVGMIPYTRLEFFSEGDGVLLFLGFDDDDIAIYRLSNYTVLESGFTVVAQSLSSEEDVETFYGQFYGTQLVINIIDEPDFKTWFSRTEPVAELRAKAEFEIKKYLRSRLPIVGEAPNEPGSTTSKSL